jgi:hypothetical protein
VYLTEGRRVAVYGANDESLTVYETFEDSDEFGPRFVADVGDALGETRGPRT